MASSPTRPSVCELYAHRFGWQLLRANIMVEGNLDVQYFTFAAERFQIAHGRHLIGKDLSIFAPGTGDAGGTFGVMEQFLPLHALGKVDLDQDGKARFRFAALLDNDRAGTEAARLLSRANRSIHLNGHVFLLWRKMPRKSREAKPLTDHIADANRQFGGLDCEIEDLIDETIIDLYAEQFPNHIRAMNKVGGGRHCELTRDGKDGLNKFFRKHAQLEECSGIIETLKSLRFYLGLDPEGKAG